MDIIISVLVSAITSIVVTKILATHYFDIVDGHVSEMTEMTKEFIENIINRL